MGSRTAPQGIVTAAVVSLFALELTAAGNPGAGAPKGLVQSAAIPGLESPPEAGVGLA
jgi:hypothetical protein